MYPCGENKGADQLLGYGSADLRLCFCIYTCTKCRFDSDAAQIITRFTQLLQTRVCFTNAGINTYGAEIHKVRKHAIHTFPLFLFLILLFRLYVKEPI